MTSSTGRPEPVDLDAVRALCDALRPGPWVTGTEPYRHELTIDDRLLVELSQDDEGRANAAFIAAARTLVPQMADELARLRAIVCRVESITTNTEGEPLAPDSEIPVGEVTRMLYDAGGAR